MTTVKSLILKTLIIFVFYYSLQKNISKEIFLAYLKMLLKDQKSYEIPDAYDVDNVSSKILKIIQGFTPKINKETWNKKQ